MRGKPYLCTKPSYGVVGYSPLDTSGEMSDIRIKRNGQVLRVLTKAGMTPIVIDYLDYTRDTILPGYTTVDYTLRAPCYYTPAGFEEVTVGIMHGNSVIEEMITTEYSDIEPNSDGTFDTTSSSGTFNVIAGDIISAYSYSVNDAPASCSVVIS